MRILIVDDSKTMRAILASYSTHLGCESVEAEDGEKALSYLDRDAAFEAVLIDWDMPKMNGLELLRAIRSDPRFDALKALMVTSQTSYDRVAEALNLGADDYLMKPLDEDMLAEKLRILGLVN